MMLNLEIVRVDSDYCDYLRQLYNSGKLPDNMKLRCCNFKLLEEKCLEYNKIK